MREIGAALRRAREERELTQTQVMAMTGINNKTLSGYENGVSEPDLQTLTILLRLYQVSADYLLGLEEGVPPAGEVRLLELYRALSREEQRKLLLVLEVLLEQR